MKVYLVQHAKAASEEFDRRRPLSEEGKRDMQKIVGFIKPLKLVVGSLWHSGKKRAAQTAGFLAGAVKIEKNIIAHGGLGPNDDVTGLRDELATTEQDIMIVGHLPFLSKLASQLLTGSESANVVAFKNGGVVCLQRCEGNRWLIDWMVTPELLA